MQKIDAMSCYDDIDGVMKPAENPILIGHRKIVDFFNHQRKGGRLHHALLFEGPRGIGKATLAFHIAWNILTEQKCALIAPDQTSWQWRQMAQSSHPSFLYITRRFDARTERFKAGIAVEDIREIGKFLNQTTRDGSWRVILIDSADDMNRNAANALLKTLEEPPKKTLFILISHIAGRLLSTIHSRCQRIVFQPLGHEEIEKVLRLVVAPPLIEQRESLVPLIEKAQGSARKAALLLCYGGMEIIRTVDDLLAEVPFNVEKAQQLAQVLAGRENGGQFLEFCDYIGAMTAERAFYAADIGDKAQALAYAHLWQKQQNEWSLTEAFNLDKKQAVISLLQRLYLMTQSLKS
ncbi:DNA polymerase III subunit delta' [Bartonella sp. DGB2]|uniref:DNA polymerase III subunit delta' n=1 Tax=Bartonella sp. DGB2 TaxID=3388426 RepID=UPI00399039B9